jgi:hypothetical protein
MGIPNSFSAEDSDYLTIPALRTFCANANLELYINRPELIEAIEEFANLSIENNHYTQVWLNHILKAGIKTCMVRRIYPNAIRKRNIIEKIIKDKYPHCNNDFICEHTPTNECELISYELEADGNNDVTVAHFVFLTRVVRVTDIFAKVSSIITYPIFIDVDLTSGFSIARSKSIANLFKVKNETEIDPAYRTSAEALMAHCEEAIKNTLNYTHDNVNTSREAFKRTIFNILNRYTSTPAVIREKINRSETGCITFIRQMFSEVDIPLALETYNDALYDMKVFIEKYASITYPDEEIFINDRMAYPVKFIAQDNEFTKIQETSSGYEDPLQRKKAFFDSKKSVYTDKKCDKICLCHKRLPRKYYGDKPYNVQIYIGTAGTCIVKFLRFVEEDDIQYVLSRIIQLYNVQE